MTSGSEETQKTVRILVAEDERPMAKALQLKLSGKGFSVDLALDGEEALEKFLAEPYDLMILDLIMPRLNGFAVLYKIRTLEIPTPVIVASNLSQQEDLDKAMKMGASGYFVKSDATLKEIVARVEGFLEDNGVIEK